MDVSEDAKQDILYQDEKGCSKFEEFASEQIVASHAKLSIWEAMQKMKLKTHEEKLNSCKKNCKRIHCKSAKWER